MQTIKAGRHMNRINKLFKMFICLQFVLQSFTEFKNVSGKLRYFVRYGEMSNIIFLLNNN